jgi:hypothetical protein
VGSSKFVLFIADRSVGTNGSLAVNGLGKKKKPNNKNQTTRPTTRTKSQETNLKNQKARTKKQEPSKVWIIDDR